MLSIRFPWAARYLFVATLVLSLLNSALPARAQDPQPDNDGIPQSGQSIFLPLLNSNNNVTSQSAPIFLRAATLTGDVEAASTPPGLTISGYPHGQRGYYIVQFGGPVQQSWKDTVADKGVELLDYLPDYAFKVRMTPAQANQVISLPSVAFVGIFQPAYKLSPELKWEGTNLFQVRVERGADAGLATAAIARSGAEILGQADGILLVAADAAQLAGIANVLDVAWVENFVLPEKHNEYGAGVIMGANVANNRGYDGSGQIVAVADTGLGNGTADDAHPDIPAARISAIYNWPGQTDRCFKKIQDDGAQDVDSAHGTHVSVSVLGDGYNGPANADAGKGTAPAANLVFQATENWVVTSNYCKVFGIPDGYYLTGLPNDLNSLYQQAYNQGARVHSNSWGSSQAGVYTASSAQSDQFIWNNPDMAITFSAGNAGVDTVAPLGVVDNDSIGSPATAKNVITVGASENARPDNFPCDTGLAYTSSDGYQSGQTCGSMGGNNFLGTAGSRWGFTTEPLNSDPTAGNAEQMAPFSSRGPTDDGRIKPDIVAPGTWILSGYSSLHQQGYGNTTTNPQNGLFQWDGWGMPLNNQYKYMGGTSMSNPLVAGAAAVVRDYYQTEHNSHNASAALVKATLINSAVDLLDEDNNPATFNVGIPNMAEGWGRVNIDNATRGSAQFVDATSGLATGNSATYQYSVAGGASFKVSLVWSDYPSTEAAAQNLVNDLNLTVTGPGGTPQYVGNVFSNGWSQTGGSADRVNNVENVYVQSTTAGIWSVQVSGANIPNGPQPYALVVDGGAQIVVDGPPTVAINSPANGSTVSGTTAVIANANDDNGVSQVEFFVDGNSIGIDTNGGDGWSVTWNTTTVSDGSHTISATATDTIGQPGSNSISVNVNNAPPTAGMHVGDLNGLAVAGSKGKWNATVSVTIHDGSHSPVSGATVSGSWSSGDSGSCVTNGSGQCSTTVNNIKGGSVTWTITDVSHSSLTYQSADNHDPDGNSTGTTIVVAKP